MKIIITGVTGLVGSSALADCIANDKITEIFALTRKELAPELATNPKVTTILHDDFLDYPPELMKRLAGAEACIWALGGRRTQFPDSESFRKVSVDYLMAAAQAYIAYLAPMVPVGRKFRMVFCSGKDAEADQNKNLLFMAETRHVKGQCEEGLRKLETANSDIFQSWFVRPTVILPRDSGCMSKVTGKLYGGVPAGRITRGMVEIALNGHPTQVVEIDELSQE